MFTGWELGIIFGFLCLIVLMIGKTIISVCLKAKNDVLADTRQLISSLQVLHALCERKAAKLDKLIADSVEHRKVVEQSSTPLKLENTETFTTGVEIVTPVVKTSPVDIDPTTVITATFNAAQLLAIRDNRPQIVTISQQPGEPVVIKMADQPPNSKTGVVVQVIDTRPIPNPYVSAVTNYTDDELRTLLNRKQAISEINDPNSKMSKDLELYLKERQKRKEQHIKDARKKAEKNAREEVQTNTALLAQFTEQAKASSEHNLFELLEMYIQAAGEKAAAATRARYTY